MNSSFATASTGTPSPTNSDRDDYGPPLSNNSGSLPSRHIAFNPYDCGTDEDDNVEHRHRHHDTDHVQVHVYGDDQDHDSQFDVESTMVEVCDTSRATAHEEQRHRDLSNMMYSQGQQQRRQQQSNHVRIQHRDSDSGREPRQQRSSSNNHHHDNSNNQRHYVMDSGISNDKRASFAAAAYDIDERSTATGMTGTRHARRREIMEAARSRRDLRRDNRRKNVSGRGRREQAKPNKNKPTGRFSTAAKPNKRYNPSLPEPQRDEEPGTFWPNFSKCMTCLIPNALIPKDGDDAKQAWREKVTIFDLMIIANLIFLFFFAVIPLYFCRAEGQTILSKYDDYVAPACVGLNYAMFGLLYLVAGLLVLQCGCSMIIGIHMLVMRYRKMANNFTEEDQRASVMVMVPCYNEGDVELRKTIKSILHTKYPDENKVLVVVADGIITGRGEWTNTPRTLANLLGFEVRKRDPAHAYKSIGSKTDNFASVYHGTYEKGGKSLKYVVIVKRGTPEEKNSSRPGNRGKRDSQLITLGLFNRVLHDRRLSPLDEAICAAFNDLHIPATELEYLLAIDADTRISDLSISYMVKSMERNKEVLACCGETRVDNKTQSWVTMIQVYEYFASHHLKKSFESVFGCVTCLPGCFTMYRMYDDDWRPLVSADNVFQSYSRNDIDSLHEKNLYLLGEDRMLTTLMLSFFPDMKLSFVPVAACWTIVPNEFKVLLSQRRRWINSTFHNMWELLKVNTMCGVCCLSMNAIVVLDMISTMILPATVVYAAYFIYVVTVGGERMSTLTLALYGVLLGTQILIFLVRSRFDYILWFLIYVVLGIPVFYLILPLYSFWNMDDLSWGTTRQVAGKPEGEGGTTEPSSKKPSSEAGVKAPSSMPNEKRRSTSAATSAGGRGSSSSASNRRREQMPARSGVDGRRSRQERPTGYSSSHIADV